MLLPERGAPVLIDWGAAAAGLIPYGDLVALVGMHQRDDDPSTEALDAFAAGYGLILSDHARIIDDLLVLGHLDLLRWALDHRPDLVDVTAAASRAGIERSLA